MSSLVAAVHPAGAAIAVGEADLGRGAAAAWLSGKRLFLQHGPINLVLRAEGEPAAVRAAYRGLSDAFPGWLGRLVEELPRLRQAENAALPRPRGPIARRMAAAVGPLADRFVTPMAAVAGAVADHAVSLLAGQTGVERAWVNNGGDIALHLAPRASLRVALVPSLSAARAQASLTVEATSPVRGIATSGWPGRSLSLGIADAVSVLARTAAAADAAATLIANEVNVDHPAVQRRPARELDESSDLGSRLVTVSVGLLDDASIDSALERGHRYARSLRASGLIEAAVLCCAGRWRMVDDARRPCLPPAFEPAP